MLDCPWLLPIVPCCPKLFPIAPDCPQLTPIASFILSRVLSLNLATFSPNPFGDVLIFRPDLATLAAFYHRKYWTWFFIFPDIVKSYKGKFSTKLLASRSYGTVESNPSQYSCAITDHWNVEGPFRKIGIKLDDNSDSQIVQGLRIELVDGSVRTFGISNHNDDEKDIFDLEVPKGQHIR